MAASAEPRVLSIQSHVVSGYVGNKCAVFACQQLGLHIDAINTVQFSNHTGYPIFKGQVLDVATLQAMYDALEQNQLANYSHMLTGYMMNENVLRSIMKILGAAKNRNPALKYVCDPVMADDGQLYPSVSPQMIDMYKAEVLKECDYLLPNQTECEFLVGFKITSEIEAFRAVDVLHVDYGIPHVIVTSLDLPETPQSELIVLASELLPGEKEARRVKIIVKRVNARFSGTGDLFAALTLAYSVEEPKADLAAVVTRVVNTIQHVIAETMTHHNKVNPNAPADKFVELRLLQCGEYLRAKTQPKAYTTPTTWTSPVKKD